MELRVGLKVPPGKIELKRAQSRSARVKLRLHKQVLTYAGDAIFRKCRIASTRRKSEVSPPPLPLLHRRHDRPVRYLKKSSSIVEFLTNFTAIFQLSLRLCEGGHIIHGQFSLSSSPVSFLPNFALAYALLHSSIPRISNKMFSF